MPYTYYHKEVPPEYVYKNKMKRWASFFFLKQAHQVVMERGAHAFVYRKTVATVAHAEAV